jgi:hypothetical protein
VIRFKVPDFYPAFKDLVNGRIRQKRPGVVDPIILKSDGFPTYHLANVVDDKYMEITHVIRGAVSEPLLERRFFYLQAWAGVDIINPSSYCNV